MAEKLFVAQSVEDAVEAKNKDNVYIAGGTETMRLGTSVKADSFVSLRKIPAMHEIRVSDTTISIGAACTFQELLDSNSVPAYLKEALLFMASRTRRNMATIGGNIALCRDDSFLVPTLLAAGAKLNLIEGLGATKTLGLEEYIAGKNQYADALILSVLLPIRAAVRSVRSANTAQSHARITASLGLSDGKYYAVAAIKNYGLVKFGNLMAKFSEDVDLSEDEIVERLKNDSKIALEDDLLYGGAAYRKYLLGITFAQMYKELKG